MLSRFLGLLIVIAIVVAIIFNFKTILNIAQAQLVASAAQNAIEAHNWEKAITVYETGLREHPRNTEIALQLGNLYQQAAKLGHAEQLYRSISQVDPKNLDAQIGLAQVLQASPEHFNDAVLEYRKALKEHSDNAELLYRIGNLYKNAAENSAEKRKPVQKWLYDQARYYYQCSLRRDPKQFQTQFNLGVAYQQQENLQPAAKAYCQSIVLNPSSYEAHFNLGMILSELNYLDEAYRQLDQSVQLASTEAGKDTAMDVAQRVQHIKSSVYNDTKKHGLSGLGKPDFLNEKCLFAAQSTVTQ